jgi:endonuclease YncB( thermonuclease family)
MPAFAADTPHGRQILHFEKVVDDGTIRASGLTIALWGITPIEQDNPYAYPAQLFLETTLAHGALSCFPASATSTTRQIRHCYIDDADIGSLMVQMGLATASDRYYYTEQSIASRMKRGIWSNSVSGPL